MTSSALLNQPPRTAEDWALTLIVAKFDAWAQRGAFVVWSDRAVLHYDQWLVSFGNVCLAELARPFVAAPSAHSDAVLRDLRHRLSAQVHVWKAVARRVCAEHQVALASHPGRPPVRSGPSQRRS